MEVLVTLMKSDALVDGNKPIDYLFAYWNHHILYCTSFFTCELLNFVNVIGQIFFIDLFFDGDFIKYGSRVIADSKIHPDDRMMDPMTRVTLNFQVLTSNHQSTHNFVLTYESLFTCVPLLLQLFPKVTKCSFPIYGASGTLQNFDAMCILPVNMLNEKIFIFLWFWLFIVATLTAIALLFRLATLLSSSFRLYLLKRQNEKCDMDFAKQLDSVFRRSQVHF